MYPKFIEVHVGDENKFLPEGVELDDRVSVNVESIQWFNGDGIVFSCNQEMLECRESYDDLKSLITDCGCLIHKQDPRLDTEHPLTMEDLQNMIGEPVWNSNIDEWGLVTKNPEWHGEIQEGYFIRYHDGTLTYLYEEGLKKYPHYRMKVIGG